MTGFVDIDELRELLTVLREHRAVAGRECAAHIRDHSEDFVACRLADRWLVLDAEVRKLERLIAAEVAG